ncbi:MAG TPA: hypothetical protein VMB21_02105 [Candidatus Limnocylindria bacterium]|nr:hypothetical protein [Candidatus Limnocylindria bacterium]
MKTRRSSVLQVWLTAALAYVSTAMVFADGELDLGFSPPPELRSNFLTSFSVIGGQAYLSGADRPVSRLREDGSLDADWQLTSPRSWATGIRGLPAGGLAIAFNTGFMVQYDDGSNAVPSVGGISEATQGSVLPQEDGSVTLVSNWSIRKVRADGTVDPALYLQVPPPQGGNFPQLTAGITDRLGRYVVIGSFQTPAPDARAGGMRLLADGSLDKAWNPQPDANGAGLGTALAITALREDSVLVVLYQELVWIDAGGEITQRIPNLADNRGSFLPPLVQPDGKIILAGGFSKWGGVPAAGLVRLNSDGSLDPSFSAALDRPSMIAAHLDTQGRLWLAGYFTKVNGVDRPGIARIQAYTPALQNAVSLEARITVSPRHIATNEALYLTAQVDGLPEPTLQWLRDGLPIDGATNRGLRLVITNGTELGHFSLALTNPNGVQQLDFPPTTLAVRSPHPGTEDRRFDHALTNFAYITQLLPLPDGRVLVAGGISDHVQPVEGTLVGRLLADGRLDPGFGQGGGITGIGQVESLFPLPGGGLLVAGDFDRLGGQPAQGLVELDASGNRVARAFPNLDITHVSAVLPLPDGKLMIAGRFTQVNGVAAYRIARLNSDLTLDTSFQGHLLDWQFVDAFALDAHGRVLMAGERVYANFTVGNPALVGLQRLLPDGSADPAFHARTTGVRTVFMEPEGRMLVGMPAARLDEDGNVLTVFEDTRYPYKGSGEGVFRSFEPNHLMIRTADGGVIYQSLADSGPMQKAELWRWRPTGERDYAFQCLLATNVSINHVVNAMALLADGSVLLGTLYNSEGVIPDNPPVAQRLRRIPRDSDLSLRVMDVSGGQFRVSLETQPGLSYEIYQREQLTGGTATKIWGYDGDGYVLDLQAPATGNAGYLELRRH